MLSVSDTKQFNLMRNKWNQFKVERNMPKYYGEVSPNWITVLQREGMVEQLMRYIEKMIKD